MPKTSALMFTAMTVPALACATGPSSGAGAALFYLGWAAAYILLWVVGVSLVGGALIKFFRFLQRSRQG